MLKNKLFKGFALLVVLSSVLSAFIGVHTIKNRVVSEAQTRVRLDLSSAWGVWNSQLERIETILRMIATGNSVVDAFEEGVAGDADALRHLQLIRVTFGLDFVNFLSPEGEVLLRSTAPGVVGDFRNTDPAVLSALHGTGKACVALLSREELAREMPELAERAFLELKHTRKARKADREVETRGMCMVAAVPVQRGAQLLGVVHGGLLINRNHALVDRMHDVVYKHEKYRDVSMGTATVFLHDGRIATTVRLPNGNRALGTRSSKEVADQVLDNARAWIGEAFVVSETYLTAYEPILDGMGKVVGMLYVGILKKPFDAYGRMIALRYVYISLFVLLVGLVLAFIIAGRLASPIHRLVEAANRVRAGSRPSPVPTDNACHETEELISAFNEMSATLVDREENLKALNRSYMETLGFVSHELKSPVATILNYVYLLRQEKLGPLTEKQQKAVAAVDSNSHRLVEMVRHYLNLSRIENGELNPVKTRVKVVDEVLAPLIETSQVDLDKKGMTLVNEVAPTVELMADMNMLREVFENLLSNAIKYGCEAGAIKLLAAPQNGMVEFRVWNEGEGIPADKLDAMFQKFSRLEGSKSVRRQKGTGLGLFITKHIVDAHDGEIRVASKEGEWAEFILTLPRFKQGKEQ